MTCACPSSVLAWLFENRFAAEEDFDFSGHSWTNHGLRFVARGRTKNDFLRRSGIIVIPAASRATSGGIGYAWNVGGNAIADEGHVDPSWIDGRAIRWGGNGQFAAEFGIGVYCLGHGIEEGRPGGSSIADFGAHAIGSFDEVRVGNSGGRGHCTVGIFAYRIYIGSTAPAINATEDVTFEKVIPAGIENARRQLGRIEGIFSAGKRFELVGG